MAILEQLHLGIVGACGRGGFAAHPPQGVRIHAICDVSEQGLRELSAKLGGIGTWTDYQEMLDTSELDAVVIGTPMPLHVPQAIAALQRGIHVLSEVPAGVSIDECQQLVAACRASKAIYMMAENMNYFRPVQIVTEMVRRGLFGGTFYAEGEYIHGIRSLFEQTPWRRKWQVGINGITYGTHSLGPILQWMPGDRVASVCCAGGGHHHRDAAGRPYEMENSCVMLGKMARGGLIKIRLDLISDGPSGHRFLLQGTDGVFEAARLDVDPSRVWLRSRCEGERWRDLEEFAAEFQPEAWQRNAAVVKTSGHGGSDYIQMLDFLEAIRGHKPSPIGIHEAMDMTLPGLISQQSIAVGGRWIDVPDSRNW